MYFVKMKTDFLKKCLMLFEAEEVRPRSTTVGTYLSDGEPLYWTPEVIDSLRGTFTLQIAPYRSELNPAEPVIGAIQDCARTLLAAAPLAPTSMWESACTYAITAMNSRPSADSFSGISPYQIINNYPPDLSHRIPFFAPAVVIIEPRAKRKRWQHKGILCKVLNQTPESSSGEGPSQGKTIRPKPNTRSSAKVEDYDDIPDLVDQSSSDEDEDPTKRRFFGNLPKLNEPKPSGETERERYRRKQRQEASDYNEIRCEILSSDESSDIDHRRIQSTTESDRSDSDAEQTHSYLYATASEKARRGYSDAMKIYTDTSTLYLLLNNSN